MEIIGQNGNEGEHYSELDLNKDGIVNSTEIDSAVARIAEIKRLRGGNINPEGEFQKEIKRLSDLVKSSLKEDDETKTY